MNKPAINIILIIFIFLFNVKCQKEKEITSDPIKIQYLIEDVSEYGKNDGSINLTVTGGVPPYTFIWSNNETTKDLENLPAGEYIVVISDSQNQLFTHTFEISQPPPIAISINFEITNPSATGMADGSVTATVSGGYPPYKFSWSNGSETAEIQNLTTGSYTLTVTDNIWQTFTDSITLADLLTDIEGNTYSTIKIGTQTWMQENLKVKHAPDNSSITSYVYNNDTTNEETFGRLYTWDVVMNGSTEESAQGICPDGWHIPSDEEVKILEMHLGMTRQQADQSNTWRGATVGTQLKSGGTSGFEALLSGRRTTAGNFGYKGRAEYFWTSTESGTGYAWRRCLDDFKNTVGRYDTFPKSYGFSIRCVKNDD